jgi:hypothetical protein
MCPARDTQAKAIPRTAAFMGQITHAGKPMKEEPANNWRAKHAEFMTAIKLGKQYAAL